VTDCRHQFVCNHTTACFKIVNKCEISKNLQDLKSRTFQGFSSAFKHLICFQALSRALKFLFQIQAFSKISQARYEPCHSSPPARCCPRWVSLYSTENSGDPASRRDISGLLAFSVAATTLRILTAGKSGHAKVWCLEQGADLHMAQLMPLLLTVSCSSKIQIGFTFLVPAHLGSTGQRAVQRVCVCFFTVCVLLLIAISYNWRCMKLNSTYSLTYLISYSTCISSASQETAFAHDHQHSIHLLAAILPNVHRF